MTSQNYAAFLTFKPATDEEIKKEIGDDLPLGTLAGYVSSPEMDSYRHVVLAGAFDEAILDRGLTGPRGIKLLIGHDSDKVAGAIKQLKTIGEKLWIVAELNLEISYSKDAYEAIKSSGGMSFSVGFRLKDYAFKEDQNGDEYLEIQRGDLFEISVVPFPANEDAGMSFFKNKKELITLGSPTALRKAILEQATGDEDEAPETVAQFEKRLVALGLVQSRNEANRITRVVKSCAELFTRAPDPESESTTFDLKSSPALTDAMSKFAAAMKQLQTAKE